MMNNTRSTVLATREPITENTVPPARLKFAPAIGIQNTLLGYGGLAELAFSTSSPFYIGVESGYFQFAKVANADNGANTERMMLIPVLATFVYRFNLERGVVHPYIGGGVGASLSNGTILADGSLSDIGPMHVDFMATGRPGVEFEFNRTTSLFLEPQFGVFKRAFIFLPQVGFAFSF